MTAKPVKIIIKSFEPLEVSFPNEPLTGEVWLVLPELHIKLIDLSMDNLIPDKPYIGGDVEMLHYKITVPDGEELSAGKLMDFITDAQANLKKLWQLYQDELNKRFLLDRSKGDES